MSRAKKEQVLQIDPPNDLQFQGNFTADVCRTKLTLTNPTNTDLAYKVKTTAPRRYCVRPNSGRIEKNNGTATVNIMLQPAQNNDDLNKHKFMVQSIILTESMGDTAVDDLFKSTPSDEIMSKKLYCSFSHEETPAGGAAPQALDEVQQEQVNGFEAQKGEQEEPNLYPEIPTIKHHEETAETVIQRPVISAVPTEPEIIHQQPAAVEAHSPPVKANIPSATPPATKLQTQSGTTKTDNDLPTTRTATGKEKQLMQRIKDLEEGNKAMAVKLKNSEKPMMMAQPVQNLQGEDPGTLNKVMIILFIIAFILGWMVSSFFCKSC